MMKKDNKENKNKIVGIRFTESYYEKIQKLAKQEKRNLADFIRMQIEKLIPQ